MIIEHFLDDIADSSLVRPELKIDNRSSRHDCGRISEKYDRTDDSSQIFTTDLYEIFLHSGSQQCREHEGAISLDRFGI